MTIIEQMFNYRGCELQSSHAKNIEKYCKSNPVLYDMACGKGALVPHISPKTKYFGIDIDLDRVSIAKKSYPGFDFRVGDCTNTGFPKDSADGVVSCETFEHIPNWAGFVMEINRVLKKGGILSLSTPSTSLYCYPSYFVRMLLFNRPAPLRVMFHWLNDWENACKHHPSTTKADIIAVLNLAGFEILEYKTVLSYYEHHYIYRLFTLWEKIQPESKLREWLCYKWMDWHRWLVKKFPCIGYHHLIAAKKI
jgi:SAM-dependent methyltransferase